MSAHPNQEWTPEDAWLSTLTNIDNKLHKIERHLNQGTWLMLLIFLAVVGATFAILFST